MIEVVVVAGIVSLLSAISIPNFLRHKATSDVASAKATLKSISTAIEHYAAINPTYPTDIALLTNASPPYLHDDYFIGQRDGFTFTPTILNEGSYTITASPVNPGIGQGDLTISTGSSTNW